MTTPAFPAAWPLALWTILILAVSSVPGNRMPTDISLWQFDKIAHFIEFFIFSVLCVRYLFHRHAFPMNKAILVSLLVGASFAAFDELHQIVIPGRLCCWQDFVADVSGVAAGALTVKILFNKRGRLW